MNLINSFELSPKVLLLRFSDDEVTFLSRVLFFGILIGFSFHDICDECSDNGR